MKNSILITLAIAGTSLSAQNKTADVDSIIKREMSERKIPGLQIAVVQSGKIALNKSYGVANIQDNIPVDSQTIFAINSCTKVFTSVAIMQLAEDGKIELSDPVSKYLDGLPPSWASVTIKQLLTHCSGLPDLLKLLDPYTGGLAALKNEEAIWEKLKSIPLEFQPGERFSYNQTNAYLLGKIIDKFREKPFAEVFSEKQFEPAGMGSTIFGDSRDVIPHFAPTYFYRTALDGQKYMEQKMVNNYYEFPYFRRTAAGLNSTAKDIAQWVIALQSGKLLKSKATIETMWSPIQFNNGQNTPWALGWGLAKFRKHHRAIGMSGGGRAAFLIYPDDDLAVIVLTNLGGGSPEDYLEELAACYIPDILNADPLTFLRINLRKTGFDRAIKVVKEQIKKDPYFKPNEFELNEWAYRMMQKGEIKNALQIFKLNVFLFPNSWNAYDSYGEALLKDNSKEEAIRMYKKSIELNQKNENGKKILETLI
ncbi:serine hydrolase domain-containing protein [Flavobacterium ginsenosidimutans]|uniref:serine hydrolase domain-containing protein n=1 Tax=Flavobacterium ginsenosidimutans TaxID=687844 RepID=UPI000DAC3086|nr:serine hydrolase domain-containing protein [Flavobacterium ginsenosidimutans]KAF2333535.1 serine hydrolase [Flavobacterium ginsenosidimutans]